MFSNVRDEWVAELRSGKYKQARHALRDTYNNYCCLGILCDIAVNHGVIDAPRLKSESATVYVYGEDDTAYLPDEVMKWAGMDTVDGSYGHTFSLASHNDGGVPFAEIADIIEAESDAL